MPYRMLGKTIRHVSLWRLVLLTFVVYAVIRLVIPWPVQGDVPFWARAIFLALGFPIGVLVGPWLYPKRR